MAISFHMFKITFMRTVFQTGMGIGMALLVILITGCRGEEAGQGRPNIIIILADDMGYSDLGCFGAEVIRTPHLDRLAAEGLMLTRFYNAARCCPSRASLLTGLYPHQAGMGSMTDQEIDLDSYAGHLSEHAVTIATVLKQSGYDTYASGKWHVGEEREHWPLQKGFDHCFSFIQGASSYFSNHPYRSSEWPWSDGTLITVEDEEFFQYPSDTLIYATDLYTDRAIRFSEMSLASGNPFFLYLAYTAPHWPLHALPEDMEKYRGLFGQGWDRLREQRYENQVENGLFPAAWELSPRDPGVPAWDSLSPEKQQYYSTLMEVYAAMIDRLDQNIGQLLGHLESSGQMENTVIFFLSDNGGCRAETVPFLHAYFSRDAAPGSPRSFTGYGPGWANASNTPFRLYKATVHEGGIATPFIAWNPARIAPGSIDHTPGHVVDLMPTCLSLAGGAYPEIHEGNRILPMEGVDLSPLFRGQRISRTAPLFFEHHGNQAAMDGEYKLVRQAGRPWELYHMEEDRTELHDLVPGIDQHVLDDLLGAYRDWESYAGVYPSDIVRKRTRTDP